MNRKRKEDGELGDRRKEKFNLEKTKQELLHYTKIPLTCF